MWSYGKLNPPARVIILMISHALITRLCYQDSFPYESLLSTAVIKLVIPSIQHPLALILAFFYWADLRERTENQIVR